MTNNFERSGLCSRNYFKQLPCQGEKMLKTIEIAMITVVGSEQKGKTDNPRMGRKR